MTYSKDANTHKYELVATLDGFLFIDELIFLKTIILYFCVIMIIKTFTSGHPIGSSVDAMGLDNDGPGLVSGRTWGENYMFSDV